MADALDYVHAQGVLHRDVKPANIFFDAFWGAFLGDFGIAKIITESDSFDRDRTLTATSMGIGTAEYMAPEQFTPRPVLDGRTDQYALAVVAYEILAGRRPFTGDSAHLIVEVTTRHAVRLDHVVPSLPASLVDAIHRGLEKQPAERFPSCRAFAAAALRHTAPLADEPDLARLLCPKPGCVNLLTLPISAAGRRGRCPKCKTEMRVAADLASLWLLDEAGGHWAGTTGGSQDIGSGSPPDQDLTWGSLPEFKPASPSQPQSSSRFRRSLFSLIDGHVLILAGAIGLIALTPWAITAGRPRPRPGKPVRVEAKAREQRAEASSERGEDLAGRAAENQSRALEETAVQEAELKRHFQSLRASRDELQRQVDQFRQSVAYADHGPDPALGKLPGIKPVFLSDLRERDPVTNFAFGKHGYSGHGAIAIVVHGQFDEQGLGMHALDHGVAKATYDVPVGATHFEARASINDTATPEHTPLTFRVITAKGDRWQSRPLRRPGVGEDCSVRLGDAKAITLEVECDGKSWHCHSVWVKPRFVTK